MITRHTGRLRLRTPEGVVFSFALASPLTRAAAWLVDEAAILAVWSVVAALLSLAGFLGADVVRALHIAGYFCLSAAYPILLEWRWHGQTLGKRLVQIRVMDVQGLPLQFPQVVVRNLLRAIDALPLCYFVGGLAATFTRKAQRLGDIAAATVVVAEYTLGPLNTRSLESPKYNSLRGQRHLAARLHAATPPEVLRATVNALLRRDRFTPEARVELFRELAQHYREVVRFPPEAGEDISDETFVRNVVELLTTSPTGKWEVTTKTSAAPLTHES